MSLPALPRTIFNPNLYSKLLHLWFDGHPLSTTGRSRATIGRWFGVSMTTQERQRFDDQCRDVAGPALDFLSPAKYPLPTWQGYPHDRQQAGSLSAPFRQLIVEDSVAPADQNPTNDTAHLTRSNIALSFFLLLDQMPRNIFRSVKDQGRIYTHYDRLARALTYNIVGSVPSDDVSRLDIVESFVANPSRRVWFYMPLEHSEDLEDHDLFESVMNDAKATCEARGDKEGAGSVGISMGFEKRHRDILERFGRYCHRNEAMGREPTQAETEFLEGGGETFGTR